MVDGIELSEDLEEHFLDLALGDTFFHFEVEGLVAGDDGSLEERLGEFEKGFAAVFDLDFFGFVFMFWRGKDDIFLVFGDLSHNFIFLSARLFHLFPNLFKGVSFLFSFNKLQSMSQLFLGLVIVFGDTYH